MSFSVHDFSETLQNKFPVFLDNIEHTYLFYSFQDSLLSIIAGKREYDIAHNIMNVILESFMSSDNNKTFMSDSIKPNNVLFENALQINEKLIGNLKKYYDESSFKGLEFYSRLNLKQKLNACRKIIADILKTPKIPDINGYNKPASDYYDFNEIKNTVILFYYSVKLYEAVFTVNNNMSLKHINNKDVFISEFFMFLSHFTFAYLIDKQNYGNDEEESKAKSFILNNLQRAVNHLERGALDILKIIVSSILTSNNTNQHKIGSLLEIRQNEYFALSQYAGQRIDAYIDWLMDSNILKSNNHINELMQNIKDHM